MTPEELIKSYDKTIRDMQSSPRGDIMLKVGVTANTMIKKRVINTGVDAKGNKYKPYSTKPMLANCSSMTGSACSKIAGSKDKRKELQWVTLKGHKLFEIDGGYKEYRELHGRQTDHVDFSFTNSMWSDVNVISNTGDHIKGVAIIGAKQEKEKKKLEGNTKRRGDILDLSKTEIDELMRLYNIGTLQIFKNNGL
jgi:hypothetical protein